MRAIIIGGCDRSGTTMLGDSLGATSNNIVTPESQFIHAILRDLAATRDQKKYIDVLPKSLIANFRFRTWFPEVDNINDDFFNQWHGISSKADLVLYFIEKYKQTAGKQDANVWVDHSPDNSVFWPYLLEIFDSISYIHIVRDGRAVFNSIRSLHWGPVTPYFSAKMWCEKVEAAERMLLANSKSSVLTKYEDLIADKSGELKRICEVLRIPFDPQMVVGRGLKVPEFSTKIHALVGSANDMSRTFAWRSTLSRRQIELFERSHLAAKKLRYYDYDTILKSSDIPRLAPFSFLVQYFMETVNSLANLWRERNGL